MDIPSFSQITSEKSQMTSSQSSFTSFVLREAASGVTKLLFHAVIW